MDSNAFVRRHAVSTYFALVFAISWAGVLAVIGPRGFPGTKEQFETLFPLVYVAMLIGPAVSGVLLTAVVSGRLGLRELASRLLRWRVGLRWYAVALLTAPILTTAVLAALSLFSRAFLPAIVTAPDKASLLLFGLVVALGAGVFEELGWTGFAVPRVIQRRDLLTSGLVVGLLWGAWHFLATLWGTTNPAGPIALMLYLAAALFSFLPPYRVLMVWVYARTGSLFVAMAMHASLTASAIVLLPAADASPLLIAVSDLAFAAALWIAVALLAGRINRVDRIAEEYAA